MHGFDAVTPIEEVVDTLDGLVRAGDGIPASELPRVTNNPASLNLVPAGAQRGDSVVAFLAAEGILQSILMRRRKLAFQSD